MARQKTSYVCGMCGARTAQWQGQCPACEAWNTLEIAVSSLAPAGANRNARVVPAGPSTSRTVTDIAQESDVRAGTGSGELDRVLGGGLVAGSVVLLGGDPGIGESTLLLQAADALSRERPVLYVSGEESVRQVASRAQRLGLEATTSATRGRDPRRGDPGGSGDVAGAGARGRFHPDDADRAQ